MKRMIEIDILRGFATVLLLMQHSGIYQFKLNGITLKYLFRTQVGFSLLGLFIFLSGFLLGMYIKKYPHIRLREYYVRRIARLYPPYVVSLILFQALLSVQLKGPDFWIHLFGLQIILAPTFSAPIITLWYFGLLIMCLLIVPIGLTRFKKASSTTFYLAVVFILAYIIHEKYQIIEIRFFYYFWIFSLGGLIGKYKPKHTKLLDNPISMLGSSVILVLTGYRLFKSQSAYMTEIHWGHILWASAYMLSFIHLAFVAASKLTRVRWGTILMQRISRGSYFTYIFHRPIWMILLLPLPNTDGPLAFIIRLFIGAPIVMYLAEKLQVFYEGVIGSRLRAADKSSI